MLKTFFKKNTKNISELLTNDVEHILREIESTGFEVRVVGGAVRNWIMGEKVSDSDIDIATTALPEHIFEIFENVVPSGLTHGTVTLVYKGHGYEITTLREDVETFGRKAKVAFCKSFEKDSNRRDFTMNALYMDRHGRIYDYHNGIRDISRKIVRFIGDPETRIREDFLRILRYFRFVAYYGDFKCSEEYLKIIYALRKNIEQLSSERILAEILKIFALDDAHKIMGAMKPVIEELFEVNKSEEILKFLEEKLENNIEHDKRLDALQKLSLVLKFSNKDLVELIRKYKFPKKMKRLLHLELKLEKTTEKKDIKAAKRYLKRIHKYDQIFFVIYWTVSNLNLRDPEQILAEYHELRDFCESGAAEFQLRASDLDIYGLPPDKLEEVMKKIKEVWLESDKELGKEELAELAEIILKNLDSGRQEP